MEDAEGSEVLKWDSASCLSPMQGCCSTADRLEALSYIEKALLHASVITRQIRSMALSFFQRLECPPHAGKFSSGHQDGGDTLSPYRPHLAGCHLLRHSLFAIHDLISKHDQSAQTHRKGTAKVHPSQTRQLVSNLWKERGRKPWQRHPGFYTIPADRLDVPGRLSPIEFYPSAIQLLRWNLEFAGGGKDKILIVF